MEFYFSQIKDLIKQRTGLACDQTLTGVLREEVRRRISETGADSPAAYYNLLVFNQDEFLKLINLLTVNETYFFREPGYIQIFINRLVPELLTHSASRKKLRILSAGCSTGEEPYTLAIALHDKYGHGFRHLFDIIGFDIDRIAVERAREGIYWKQSFRSTDPEWTNRYFEKIDSYRHQIKDIIKHAVTFLNVNLSEATYPEVIQNIDVIFYRNVSIYFYPDTQKKIFVILSNLLNENGYLIVSSTETLSHNYKILNLIEIDGLFLFHKSENIPDTAAPYSFRTPLPDNRKSLSVKLKAQPSLTQHNPTAASPVPVKTAIGQKIQMPEIRDRQRDMNRDADEAKSLVQQKKYDDALQLTDAVLRQNPSFVNALLLRAYIMINIRNMQNAKRDCMRSVEIDPLCMEGYFLSGLIEKYENRVREALNFFKKSLYLHPENWLSHFYMAEIYHLQNDNKNALREYQIIMRLIEDGHFHHHGLTVFPVSFSESDIKHLCRYHIEKKSKL